ncbi:MAG: hypothetical protein AB7Q97_00910 [Gammaproteobacteria bacterium]
MKANQITLRAVRAMLFAAAAVSFPGVAGATGFMPWTDIMKQSDADQDGGISMTEVKEYKLGDRFVGFQPWMRDHFAELDTDRDGKVSHAELEAGMKTMKMDEEQLSGTWTKGLGFMPREAQPR